MTSTRPRRSAQRMSYKKMMESDTEDTDSDISLSDLSSELSDGSLSHCSQKEQTTSLVEVVRLPTASDILETQEQILLKTAELNAFDAEYQATKRKFEIAEAKRSAMLQAILKSRAYLARVRTLPQEVLGLVFQFYTSDPTQSPWTLMQVTRTWRATALYTGSIWSRLLLTSPAWQEKAGIGRRKGGREVCGTKEQLNRALKRAGSAPLDIAFALTNPLGKRVDRKYDSVAMNDMVSLLASTRKCLRIHHLEIDGACDFNLQWKVEYDDDAVGLRFPELRTICVKAYDYTNFVANVSRSAKRLERAELVLHSSWVGHPALGFLESIKYSTLVTLCLDGKDTISIPTANSLKKVLDDAPFITTLELTRMEHYPYEEPAAILRLPNLTRLVLHHETRLWSFDAPSLTHLTLNNGGYLPIGPPGSNHFPLLSSLTITGGNRVWMSPLKWLTHVTFPPLHTLELSPPKGHYGFKHLVGHIKQLNPILLRLRKVAISTEELVGIIDKIERLEELQLLEGVTLSKHFFQFLATKRPNSEEGEGGGIHCPRLVRLQADLKGARAQKKTIKVLAKKLIRARLDGGVAMGACLLRFADETNWVNLVR